MSEKAAKAQNGAVTMVGRSRLKLLGWKLRLAVLELASHVAEFSIVSLILILLYGWAYWPRMVALARARPGLASPIALIACAFIAMFALLSLASLFSQAGRTFYAVAGLGLREEYRLALSSFVLRKAWIAVLVILACLPLAASVLRPLFFPALFILFCLVCYPAVSAFVFWLKSGHGKSATLPEEEKREGHGFRPRLGIRGGILLGELKSLSGAVLIVCIVLVIEVSAAVDLLSAARSSVDRQGLLSDLSSRGRATLLLCASLASQLLLEYFGKGIKLFYRLMPLSFGSYVREKILPVLGLFLGLTLPLFIPLAVLAPASIPLNLAALSLFGLSASFFGEMGQSRPAWASLIAIFCGIVLAFLSFSFPIPVLLGLSALAAVLGYLARRHYYHDEVYE